MTPEPATISRRRRIASHQGVTAALIFAPFTRPTRRARIWSSACFCFAALRRLLPDDAKGGRCHAAPPAHDAIPGLNIRVSLGQPRGQETDGGPQVRILAVASAGGQDLGHRARPFRPCPCHRSATSMTDDVSSIGRVASRPNARRTPLPPSPSRRMSLISVSAMSETIACHRASDFGARPRP